jgi:hypothetical protein
VLVTVRNFNSATKHAIKLLRLSKSSKQWPGDWIEWGMPTIGPWATEETYSKCLIPLRNSIQAFFLVT